MFPSVSHHPLFLSARRLHSPPTTTSSPLRLPGAGWSRACTLRSEEKQLALGLVRIRRGNACGVAVEESLPRITEGVSDGRVAWGAVLQDLPPPGSPVPRRCSPSLHQVEHVDLRRRAVAQAVRGQMGSGCCGLLRAGATGFQAMEGRLRRAGPMRPIRTGRQDNQRRKRLLPHLPR